MQSRLLGAVERLVRDVGPSALVVVALWGQDLLRPLVGERHYLLMYPALAFGALFGRRWAAVAATGIATLGVWFVFAAPPGSWALTRSEDAFGLAIFAGIGLLFISVSTRLRESASRHREAEALRRTHEATERSEQQFRLIADAIPILISRVDREGRYLYVNAEQAGSEECGRTDAVCHQRRCDRPGGSIAARRPESA